MNKTDNDNINPVYSNYKLPVETIRILVKLKVISSDLALPPSSADHEFLDRYRSAWMNTTVISGGLSLWCPKERHDLCFPRQKAWCNFVRKKYRAFYEGETAEPVQAITQRLYRELLDVGMTVNTAVRKKVQEIRRSCRETAKRKRRANTEE